MKQCAAWRRTRGPTLLGTERRGETRSELGDHPLKHGHVGDQYHAAVEGCSRNELINMLFHLAAINGRPRELKG